MLQLNEQRSKERMTGGPPSGEKTEKGASQLETLKGGKG